MLKRLAAIGAAAAITAGGALLATPAQATIPRPEPVQQVTRTVNLRAGEGCEFPVRIRVRISDLDIRRNGRITTFNADGVRGRVTNLRNGDTFRFSGDSQRRLNRRTDVLRGDGAQLVLLNRNRGRTLEIGDDILPRREARRVNRLVFTEDPTRGLLLGNRGGVSVLPRERLLSSGDLVNVCRQIR